MRSAGKKGQLIQTIDDVAGLVFDRLFALIQAGAIKIDEENMEQVLNDEHNPDSTGNGAA